ncbi:MAG: phosphatase PAP2-related protein [Candidatus Kapabacteria bacterium]|nr:phosphatase PAP2-related protein [Candidatus Kapabacteria bacterium]
MKQPSWKEFLQDRRQQTLVGLTFVTLFITLFSYTRFLNQVEVRAGVSFVDPLHSIIGPVDMTVPIFIVLYGALIIAIAAMIRTPVVLFKAIRGYTMLIGIRIVCMWLLPLDPPTTMIALGDPLVQLFTTGSSAPLTRDLFFSGHTSILCLVGFLLPQRMYKAIFFTLAIIVGAAVILQHVHYSIDVVVAPLAAWAAASMSGAADRS